MSEAANVRIHGLEAEASQWITNLVANMRLAEERAEAKYRQTILTWEQEASNTVNTARSEIMASQHKAEAEEREKHETARRLHEAEVEKRNLASQLHQIQQQTARTKIK